MSIRFDAAVDEVVTSFPMNLLAKALRRVSRTMQTSRARSEERGGKAGDGRRSIELPVHPKPGPGQRGRRRRMRQHPRLLDADDGPLWLFSPRGGFDPAPPTCASGDREALRGSFKAHCLAVSSKVGTIPLHESLDNLRGSVFDSHRNVQADRIRTYEVESVDLAGLPNRLGVGRVDLLKLDLEGAEFDLIAGTSARDFEAFGQVFVEFHHGIVSKYSEADTRAAVEAIKGFGWAAHSVDQTNHLFYRSGR